MKAITTFSLSLLSFSVIVSCSTTNNISLYRQEAKAHCEVFLPEKWENINTDLEPWELQNLIVERINEAVKSKEMRAILDSLTKVKPKERYSYYIQEVNKLTKEQNGCPSLKDYLG